MVVVIVRDHGIDAQELLEGDWEGWKHRGPIGIGDTTSERTGSVITRTPSISIRALECPNHAARSPSRGGLWNVPGFIGITGISNRGSRTWPCR
jgi:hypothetical protein